jgi:anaerobic selenocysteine-containing dehydrogenase
VVCRQDKSPEWAEAITGGSVSDIGQFAREYGATVIRLGVALERSYGGGVQRDTPIKSMMCWNTNPVTQASEIDEITAGIVLPASMGAEREDVILSWGHRYLIYNEKCIESPGKVLPENEIFRRLARKINYRDENFGWLDSECLEHYSDWDAPACEGIVLII